MIKFATISLFLSSALCFAHVDESLEECVKNYGPELQTEVKSQIWQIPVSTFKKNDVEVQAHFVDGRVAVIFYFLLEKSDAEIVKGLLKTNSEKYTWKSPTLHKKSDEDVAILWETAEKSINGSPKRCAIFYDGILIIGSPARVNQIREIDKYMSTRKNLLLKLAY